MNAEATVYVYGVVGAQAQAPAGTGIDDQPLRLVQSEAVAAVVSDIHGEQPEFARAALTAHSDALEAVLAVATVLPMRFGVIMESEEAVQERLLQPHQVELREQLDRLEGRVELTLRATYEEAPLMREILASEPRIRELHATNRGGYLEQVQLGEMIAKAVEQRRRRDTDQILASLAPLAEDIQLGEPRHERMALSASFLIPRDGIAAFDAAVDDVGRTQKHRMRLRYAGPLPPHSFVNLQGAS